MSSLHSRLSETGIHFRCVQSIEGSTGRGLIDVLPLSAGKRSAIDFLASEVLDAPATSILFPGESGNDLDALVSPYRAVLVANATRDACHTAEADCRAAGLSHTLFVAKGAGGLNGNYAAGIIGGLCHFPPEARDWIRGDEALARDDAQAAPLGGPAGYR